MIEANKKLISTTLTQGVLGIHSKLITLYQSNLSTIATQAALVSGFSASALAYNYNDISDARLAYTYYTLHTISFVSALTVLSQATIVVTYCPAFALKGLTSDAVKIAAIAMFTEQVHIYKIACVSITSLFIGSCVVNFSQYPHGISFITTSIFIIGYCYMVYNALRVYKSFKDIDDDKHLVNEDGGNTKLKLKGSYTSINSGDTDSTSMSEIIENTKVKSRGMIWRRQPLEQGGLFSKYYMVLEKGKIDFYKNFHDYKDYKNPVNSTPYNLWEYDIETDITKFESKVTSLRSLLTSTLVGNDEFSMPDMMKSEYDLKYASKNFKFALIPKIASELSLRSVVELIADNEQTYNHWVSSLTIVIEAFDILAQNPSVEQSMKVGSSSVDTIILAANK